MTAQIVEELEDRFGTQIDDMLHTVRSSLTQPASAQVDPSADVTGEAAPEQYFYSEDTYMEEDRWDNDANDVVFDDTGEGAGIEGDLDVDDD